MHSYVCITHEGSLKLYSYVCVIHEGSLKLYSYVVSNMYAVRQFFNN